MDKDLMADLPTFSEVDTQIANEDGLDKLARHLRRLPLTDLFVVLAEAPTDLHDERILWVFGWTAKEYMDAMDDMIKDSIKEITTNNHPQ